MTDLWTADEVRAATRGTGPVDWVATGVSIDTRTLQAGDLFVALTDQRDGHEFVAQALDKGAAAALVSHWPDGVAADAPMVLVADVLTALGDLARARRSASQARFVAVTGSVGKTSTKDMLQVILSGQGKTHVAEKSYNNQWGVPLTLARLPRDSEFAVIEIGMNHPGEILPLATMVRPHVALITTVGAVHQAAFEDVNAIAREKSAIFAGLEPGGHAVINGDLSATDLLLDTAQAARASVLTFGFSAKVDFRIDRVWVEDGTTNVLASHKDSAGTAQSFLFKLTGEGRHFALNAVASLAVSQALGADLAIAACDLANWVPPAGRGSKETIVLDVVQDQLTITLINDAFNANPLSVGAALDVLALTHPSGRSTGHSPGRRIAILGDMLELGPDEKQLHRDLRDIPALDEIDVVHCVGPLMGELYATLPAAQRGDWFETADDLVKGVAKLVNAGDVVLVKGSKGSHVSRAVDAIRKLGQVADEQVKGTN